jgi:antitoxin (DNA-binding transcriptional repressor) of toxin-antitoxin stability system
VGGFFYYGTKLNLLPFLRIMQTYAIPSQSDLSRLAHLAANGQEVLLTENNKPLAKLVPIDEDEAYHREVRSLMSFAKGMRAFEREHETLRKLAEEEIETYRQQVRALRGSLKGIDTTVEREDDRV